MAKKNEEKRMPEEPVQEEPRQEAEKTAEPAAEKPEQQASDVLRVKAEKLEEELKTLKEQHLRTLAEYDNFRKAPKSGAYHLSVRLRSPQPCHLLRAQVL